MKKMLGSLLAVIMTGAFSVAMAADAPAAGTTEQPATETTKPATSHEKRDAHAPKGKAKGHNTVAKKHKEGHDAHKHETTTKSAAPAAPAGEKQPE